MKIVYADALLALNAAVDYLLLLAAGRLSGLALNRPRMGLGALLGGVYALLSARWPGFFSLLSVKALAGALLVWVAFAPQPRLWRGVLSFYLCGAALGGCVYALTGLRNAGAAPGSVFPVSLPTLALAFALGYALLSLVLRRRARQAQRRVLRAELSLGDRRAVFSVLEDTGNELRDPVSGRPVLVAECAALGPLLDRPETLALDPAQALEPLRRQGLRARLLPCRSVTGGALLLCFLPDAAVLEGRPVPLAVAVSREALCADGEYQGIVGGPERTEGWQ